jgi:hypothetical protein
MMIGFGTHPVLLAASAAGQSIIGLPVPLILIICGKETALK